MDKDRKMMIFCLLLAAMSSPAFTAEWKANVVKKLHTLVSSCVVIPCTFTHPKGNLPSSRLRAIWHVSNKRDQRIYYEDQTQVLENYRGRTRMLGHLGQTNCTLEIVKVKDHDNGPFCFRVELAISDTHASDEKFSFVEDCVDLIMFADPPELTLTHPKTAYQGLPFTVTCTVPHTCPSHAPNITWNRGTPEGITEVHREVHAGNWEVQSILTFIPEDADDHTEVTCTSYFNGGKTSSKTVKLYVKRKVNYNHIIIPIVVLVGTSVIFSAFCIVMMKKYKTRIAELQSQDGSMWNRLSRLSRRNRPDRAGPSRSEPRRSIWSRFSRRPRVDMDQMSNNALTNSSANQKFSKPRCPSPKSQPKSSNYKEEFDGGNVYGNTVDLNIYGNV
uniref:myelin-associated glycoprotein-like n=1 Tax=Semicossyphus pulcher TaxID=241346 RepID=UPI0037E7E7FD